MSRVYSCISHCAQPLHNSKNYVSAHDCAIPLKVLRIKRKSKFKQVIFLKL